MIKVRNLYKDFNDIQILKGINFDISKGEFVSILGSSGAGKTTLLQILGTLDNPSIGEVLINQTNPYLFNEKKLAQFRNLEIGFVFQFHHLLPEFTAHENICIPAYISNSNIKEIHEKADDLLNYFDLSNRANHKPDELSGGELQRISVARALINTPSILLADEPTGNLDSESAKQMHKLFANLNKEFNQTIIVVTHNKELANITQRQLFIRDGIIV